MALSRSLAAANVTKSASALRMVASSAARVSGGATGCCCEHPIARHAMEIAAKINENERLRDMVKPPMNRVRADGRCLGGEAVSSTAHAGGGWNSASLACRKSLPVY